MFQFVTCEIAQLCWAWNCIFWHIFKTSSSDVVNGICFHTGIKNLDLELNCRSSVNTLCCSPVSVIRFFQLFSDLFLGLVALCLPVLLPVWRIKIHVYYRPRVSSVDSVTS